MATEKDVRRIALSLRELITESWRLKAPKRVLKEHGDHLPGARAT